MNGGAAPVRPKVFSALIVGAVPLLGLLALVGRRPVTEGLAALYLVLVAGAILGQAGRGSS